MKLIDRKPQQESSADQMTVDSQDIINTHAKEDSGKLSETQQLLITDMVQQLKGDETKVGNTKWKVMKKWIYTEDMRAKRVMRKKWFVSKTKLII